ncbi:EGF-like domain-containing protein [Dictyostelium discoideum AX4]|uniref:EGF-like domain-containing protein n=1 Tax=Dictyostelium discoideum TaxID=44689 RepID=Q556L7_DICDI|nr:EGF-like domain-containing protein [Dictyostelium discoideum AX4]XP_645073.1 EGF-like domain-containing protein [Dictyostelium discoideum AX4]EAL70416.1 EGF-like domain-containing protein [Dictyostelium discoideum AX4]EAL71086.1 EGF-like domain-containing protein [Dictyostelium discoideum AX4]|eukprot:XP_644341.1 EGF-like domain-containing protein [Dictyostelium discoideum AX4]
MIKKILLIILTLAIINSFSTINNLIIGVEGQFQLYDITNQEEGAYNRYPDSTNQKICSYVFSIAIVDYSNSGTNLMVFTNDTDATVSLINKKEYGGIATVIVKNKTPNTYTLLINATLQNDQIIYKNISITYSCEYIPRELMKVNVLTSNNYKFTLFPYTATIHFAGLKYPLNLLNVSSPSNVAMSLEGYSNLFFVGVGFDKNNLISEFNISIRFLDSSDQQYTVNITIPFLYFSKMNVEEKDITFKIYPNQTDVKEFGINCSPVYSITLNETIEYDPLFIEDITNNIPTPSYEIPGKGTTFIGQVHTQYSIFAKINNSLTTIYSDPNLNVFNNFNFTFPNVIVEPISVPLTLNSTMFSFGFNSNTQYETFSFYFRWNLGFQYIFSWPFGFESGQNSNYSLKASFLKPTYSPNNFGLLTFNNRNLNIQIDNTINSSLLPLELESCKVIYLFEQFHLLRIKIKPTYKEIGYNLFIQINDDDANGIYRQESLVDAENNIYEIVYDFKGRGFQFLSIGDSTFKKSQVYYLNSYFSINPFSVIDYKAPTILPVLIENITFLKNYIDVANKSVDNIIYFNYNGTQTHSNPSASFSLFILNSNTTDSNIDFNSLKFATWNSTISKYQIKFTVLANTRPGPLSFFLWCGFRAITNDMFPLSSQLIVVSKHFDEYGPIFSNIEKVNSTNEFGWKFTIDDPINGFDYGDIIVRGEMDSSTYKFHLTTQNLTRGDKFNGDYQINITLPSKCASQNYIITQVKLYDTQGYSGEFSVVNGIDGIKNVFINYLSDPTINKVYKTCSGENDGIDSSPPILTSFIPILRQNSDGTQYLLFNFEAVDIESGLKDKQYPIVYIQTIEAQTLECVSSIISINETAATYTCTINLPIGFGYNSDIIFSVYGFINNGGYYSGYSSESLNNLSFIYTINNIAFNKVIQITKCSKFNSFDSELWITGRCFNSTQQVYVKYEGDSSFNQIIVPTTVYWSAMFIKNIKPTDKPFIIKVSDLPLTSNEFTVNPIVYNFIDPTPTQTPIPTSSPIPTNKPQTCLGEPVCGGSKQGFCSPSGCICYPPWIGNDCNSQVIIIPQPSTNTSQPSTELPIIDNNNQTSNSTNYLFKSLISIVSLRELDFNSNQVNLYTFDKWIYTPINNIKSQYFTSIQSGDTKSTNPLITNITVTLEWFNQTKIIQFANNNITMNPSSIKYTIEITEYKFLNQLNSLQLVMSALFESSTSKDTCSLKEFGDTSDGDNSNFFKIQIDDHSLYGRFIKRAIIDSKVSSIENQLLDSKMNSVQTSSVSQSFIGITIPNYKQSIIIDPDFSVLVDSKPVSNNDNNSICTSNKSKLTSAQLAGIIIGSVAFATVVIVSVVYLVVKNKKSVLFQRKVQNKLQKMN